MIACASSPGRLFAAPFAVLGSIGVIGQTLNIHKALEGWGVRPLVFRGGRDKAPIGLLGEITNEGIAKVQDMVDDTHRAFKRHVAESRPLVAEKIEELATGDIWLGYDALDLGLVDRIVTSDEYIGERLAEGARVLKLVQLVRPKYPFQRPTTAGSFAKRSEVAGSSTIHSFLSNARSLLEKLAGLLNEYVADDDFPALARATSLNEVRAASMLGMQQSNEFKGC
jgi:ClpP class serine protease